MYKNALKKIVDFVIALIALIVLSPVFLIVFIILFVSNQGKPFFFQKRIGKKEIPFNIIKFKTMNDKKGKDGELLSDAIRLTSTGKFVRKTSLDELPQLLNVLKGDMSLIGPRPLLPEYLPLYSYEQKKRHNLKPGITGWAQINGRNTISWTEKFKLDLWYVDNISFKLDIIIFFKTFKKVLISEGISANNHITAAEFNGKN